VVKQEGDVKYIRSR